MSVQELGSLVSGKVELGQQARPVLHKFTGDVLATLMDATPEIVDRAITDAVEGFRTIHLPAEKRYRVLTRAAALLLEHKQELALTLTREVGKPIKDAQNEVDRAAHTLSLSADEARHLGGETIPIAANSGAEDRVAFTQRVPLGVVCAITPFNSPLNLAAHKVGPAFAAGNAVVLKPSELTPIATLRMAELLLEAGMPPAFLHVVNGSGAAVGQQLLEDKRFRCYSFTGSRSVGAHILSTVGIRKVLLELGNNSATIVHHDGDVRRAADLCARHAVLAAGQTCISVQRVYVHRKVVETFTEAVVAVMSGFTCGNPEDPTTDVGPLITEQAAIRAEAWINEAVAAGARVLCGGRRMGPLLEPTVLSGVTPEMKVVCEEVFAPLLSVIPYDDLDEAIAWANDSNYGLQAGIFTRDMAVAFRAMKELDVGAVMVNDTSRFRVDGMPYGGIKDSGLGREGPRWAVQEMTEPKMFVLRP